MQTSLLKPKIIAVESLGDSHAKVVMEPFERGYGHTLGNALRRVLLSSMIGYAPTEVTIAGVVHEYSTLDGVQEDVVNLLLNLKGVVFKLHNRDDVVVAALQTGMIFDHRGDEFHEAAIGNVLHRGRAVDRHRDPLRSGLIYNQGRETIDHHPAIAGYFKGTVDP